MNGHAQTQTDRLMRYLQTGRGVTPLGALKMWGIFRLAARIHSLRKAGISVQSQIVRRGKTHYSRYSL